MRKVPSYREIFKLKRRQLLYRSTWIPDSRPVTPQERGQEWVLVRVNRAALPVLPDVGGEFSKGLTRQRKILVWKKLIITVAREE